MSPTFDLIDQLFNKRVAKTLVSVPPPLKSLFKLRSEKDYAVIREELHQRLGGLTDGSGTMPKSQGVKQSELNYDKEFRVDPNLEYGDGSSSQDERSRDRSYSDRKGELRYADYNRPLKSEEKDFIYDEEWQDGDHEEFLLSEREKIKRRVVNATSKLMQKLPVIKRIANNMHFREKEAEKKSQKDQSKAREQMSRSVEMDRKIQEALQLRGEYAASRREDLNLPKLLRFQKPSLNSIPCLLRNDKEF